MNESLDIEIGSEFGDARQEAMKAVKRLTTNYRPGYNEAGVDVTSPQVQKSTKWKDKVIKTTEPFDDFEVEQWAMLLQDAFEIDQLKALRTMRYQLTKFKPTLHEKIKEAETEINKEWREENERIIQRLRGAQGGSERGPWSAAQKRAWQERTANLGKRNEGVYGAKKAMMNWESLFAKLEEMISAAGGKTLAQFDSPPGFGR